LQVIDLATRKNLNLLKINIINKYYYK